MRLARPVPEPWLISLEVRGDAYGGCSGRGSRQEPLRDLWWDSSACTSFALLPESKCSCTFRTFPASYASRLSDKCFGDAGLQRTSFRRFRWAAKLRFLANNRPPRHDPKRHVYLTQSSAWGLGRLRTCFSGAGGSPRPRSIDVIGIHQR